jgi:tetratricopeptide (TPR) repeat protein
VARRRADRQRPPRTHTITAPDTPLGQRGRLPRAALAAAGAIVVLALVVFSLRRTADEASPPLPLPELSSQTPAVGAHLEERHEAARRAPGSADAVGALCVAYHADMFYDQAQACYDAVTALAPGEWRWMYYRALLRADRGGGDALVDDLRSVVAQAPGFAPAWLRLGDAEFKAGRYEQAASAWDRAARLPEPARPEGTPPHVVETPVVAYAVTGLARIALARGDTQRAADLLEDVANGAPSFSSAFRLLADAYTALERAGDAAQALDHARRLSAYAPYADPLVDPLARESRNSTFLMRLASEASLGVNAEWSEYLSRRALEFDPDNPEVVSKLARVLRTLGRSAEALPYFERYHEMVPGDHEGLAQLGSCLSDLGRYDEAEPLLRRALQAMNDAVTQYNLALLLARTDRLEEAVPLYERALRLDPAHTNARINLASVHARLGDLQSAERELSRVVTEDPRNAAALTNLGVVLVQQGRPAQAVRAFEDALRIDPAMRPAAEALESLARQRLGPPR